jgi:hypothetical protein
MTESGVREALELAYAIQEKAGSLHGQSKLQRS